MSRRRSEETILQGLPSLLRDKITKTGYTRGAERDEIYQNRVTRNNTVLIKLLEFDRIIRAADNPMSFDKGFIVLIQPTHYFGASNIQEQLSERGLILGNSALIFYGNRAEWLANNPDSMNWNPARQRQSPLGGEYVARIAGTTALGGETIIRGFDTTKAKGAGIRVYEYASKQAIEECRLQLAVLYWLCFDAHEVAQINGMDREAAVSKSAFSRQLAESHGLLDMERLLAARAINEQGQTVCPLCLEALSGHYFFSRVEQAEGREVHDLTTTQVSLFHIKELRVGEFNHHPYNVGWGHHHCNVVATDKGIPGTLNWMNKVLQRNRDSGYVVPQNSAG